MTDHYILIAITTILGGGRILPETPTLNVLFPCFLLCFITWSINRAASTLWVGWDDSTSVIARDNVGLSPVEHMISCVSISPDFMWWTSMASRGWRVCWGQQACARFGRAHQICCKALLQIFRLDSRLVMIYHVIWCIV